MYIFKFIHLIKKSYSSIRMAGWSRSVKKNLSGPKKDPPDKVKNTNTPIDLNKEMVAEKKIMDLTKWNDENCMVSKKK